MPRTGQLSSEYKEWATLIRTDLPTPRIRSSLERLFLTCDGTLTQMLEVLSGEPMVLCKLRQQPLQVPERIEALDVNAGDWIVDRRVLLEGKYTDTTYVYARSLIVPERLDPCFREELLESNIPVGLLWRKHKFEMFKEVLSCHVGPAGELGRYFRIPPETLVLTRACGVRAGGRPVMCIAESLSPSLDDF